MRKSIVTLVFLAMTLSICTIGPICRAELIGFEQMMQKTTPSADRVFKYGESDAQFAELWLPSGTGPHPVVVLVHGGCWRSALPGAELVRFVASWLRESGIAVWSIEYRRLGQKGGGYPGTFLDAANGADHIKKIAPDYNLDLSRAIAVGHSAGGHLALWLAGRHRLPSGSVLFQPAPLKLKAAVSLGGLGDLRGFRIGDAICGEKTIPQLVGLGQRGEDLAYSDTSPSELLPLGVPQVMIHGALDGAVPPFYGYHYCEQAVSKGDTCRLIVIEGAGHFEVIAPWVPQFHKVKEAILGLIK